MLASSLRSLLSNQKHRVNFKEPSMTTNRNMLERAKQSSAELLREKMQMFLDNIDLNEEATDESTGLIFMIELAQRLERARLVLKENSVSAERQH